MAIQQITTVSSAVAPVLTARTAAPAPASAHAPLPEAPPVRLTTEQVEQVVKEVQQAIEPLAQNLEFSIDQGTGHTVVKVIDTATQEVVRQIPSEELMSIAHSIDKLRGLLLNHKA